MMNLEQQKTLQKTSEQEHTSEEYLQIRQEEKRR
jgi:hypothetical protein